MHPFTRNHPCPICGGHRDLPHGQGMRCFGARSGDGRYAHCTREEHAGPIPRHLGTQGYPHLLEGPCRCGRTHGLAPPSVPAAASTVTPVPAGSHESAGAPAPTAFRSGPSGSSEQGESFPIVYSYRDERGLLRHQTVRLPGPKRFRQRRPAVPHPDPNRAADWIDSLEGIETVLYRLPELLVPSKAIVLLAEGEKDAERLAALGFRATTAPMGACHWEEQYTRHLAGQHVAILEDNDAAGRDGAQVKARALSGRVASLRIVSFPEVPPGGDVSDFLDRRSPDDLRQRIIAAPPWRPTGRGRVRYLHEIEEQEVTYLWEPYIPRGKLTIVEGDPGVRKSFYAQWLCALLSRGLLPGQTNPATALLLCGEDDPADSVKPRLRLMRADLRKVGVLEGIITAAGDLPMNLDEDGLAVLEETIALHRPSLVVIDPLVSYMGTKRDLHRANEVRGLTAPLVAMAQQHDCAIVAIRHLNKSGGANATYRGIGTIDLYAVARSVILLGLDREDRGCTVAVQTKCSYAEPGPAQAFCIQDGVFTHLGCIDRGAADLLGSEEAPATPTAASEAEAFLRAQVGEGGITATAIEEARREAGVGRNSLDKAKARLGIRSERRGGEWYWYPPSKGSTSHSTAPTEYEPAAASLPQPPGSGSSGSDATTMGVQQGGALRSLGSFASGTGSLGPVQGRDDPRAAGSGPGTSEVVPRSRDVGGGMGGSVPSVPGGTASPPAAYQDERAAGDTA